MGLTVVLNRNERIDTCPLELRSEGIIDRFLTERRQMKATNEFALHHTCYSETEGYYRESIDVDCDRHDYL